MTTNAKRARTGLGWRAVRKVEAKSMDKTNSTTKTPAIQTLSDKHLHMLREDSGISDEVIAARGYRTVTNAKDLIDLGFGPSQCHTAQIPGLLLPLRRTDGGNGLYIYRPDNPRAFDDKHKPRLLDGTYPQRVIKYEIPKDAGIRLDCPPTCQPKLADPRVPLWVTEGQKKADALASRDQCAIALLGVWNFKGKNEFGAVTLLADWDHVALEDREVRIVFDSDVMTKPDVRKALQRLVEHLQRKGARVAAVYLPPGMGGKTGVDDWLAQDATIAELEALIVSPRPEIKATPPTVELLDASPALITRPLALIDGTSYAATWLHVRVIKTETTDKQGNVIKLNPPRITSERRLFVVRNDGQIFGDGGNQPLEAIGAEVRLPEAPPSDRLWSSRAVQAYANGQRPDPANVFNRVVDTVDRFIDFDKSLAGQRTMVELIGCYIFATWQMDAFNVAGFLWPNGDRGSGKTQLLVAICELAYLGQVILSGGSFASLRDMADMGATLAFDDAEGLSDPRKTDPDKRALLLAGNRRGNTVPVKESSGDRTWRTRYVNTFCPRLFSATRLPDPILASRTIVVPLIRTPDKYRANADPLEYSLWPHDRRKLIDDLWALGLAHLPEFPAYEREVNDLSQLAGRNLEPWRALLAVALWLERRGVKGLWQRMDQLSMNYQRERVDLEPSDLTALVIRALVRIILGDVGDVSDVSDVSKVTLLETAQITEAVIQEARETEADIEPDYITSRRVGRVLSKMRFKKNDKNTAKGWQIATSDLRRWAASYGVILPDDVSLENATTLPGNVTNATNVTNVTETAKLEEFEL